MYLMVQTIGTEKHRKHHYPSGLILVKHLHQVIPLESELLFPFGGITLHLLVAIGAKRNAVIYLIPARRKFGARNDFMHARGRLQAQHTDTLIHIPDNLPILIPQSNPFFRKHRFIVGYSKEYPILLVWIIIIFQTHFSTRNARRNPYGVKPRQSRASRNSRPPADRTQPRFPQRARLVASNLPVVRNERPQVILHSAYEGGVSDLSSSVLLMVAHHLTGVFLTLSGRCNATGTWDYFWYATTTTYYRPRSSCGRVLMDLLCNRYFERNICNAPYYTLNFITCQGLK